MAESDSPTSRPIRFAWVKALLLVGLGLLANGLWLGEVVLVKGWEGLRWLQGYPWAAPATAVATALGTLITGTSRVRPTWWRIVGFLLVVSAVLWASFEMSRWSLFILHSRGFLLYLGMGTLSQHLDDAAVVLAIPFAILLAAGVIYLSVSRFLGRVSRRTVLYIVAAFVLVVPASLLTIQLLPARNYFTDYIHAVKMGYPAFWTVVLVSAAVAFGRRSEAQ